MNPNEGPDFRAENDGLQTPILEPRVVVWKMHFRAEADGLQTSFRAEIGGLQTRILKPR